MSTIQECQYQECRAQECPVRKIKGFTGAVAGRVTRFFSRIQRLAHRIALRYDRWAMIKTQQRQLITMDDRMLNDIGLSRADAVRIASGPRFWSYMRGSEEENSDQG